MSAVIGAISTPKATTSPVRWALLVLGLVGMAIYAADTAAAASLPYLPFDVPIERFIQSISWGPLVQVFTALDWIEGTRQQVLGVAGILLVAAVNWRAVPLMIVGALSGGIYTLTAMFINRPRPSADLVHVIRHTGASSYPSGHVAFFSWFLILLILCLAVGRLPKAIVAGLWVIAGLVLISVCIGRIYLGEHWPSDIVGGLALGLGWTSLALSVRLLSNPALARKK
ncbi:MAG TPA: phosphatase PAP2 family protein [Verrucomicrobiae bacterium]|nr:phosphatase PAP2 family protein [Verrucomicrobiae bacterium]